MAILDSGDISIVVNGSDSSFQDFGGNDTYTISPVLSGNVTIEDNDASTIILPPGIDITAARFLADGVQFTVNGFTVTMLGDPSQFSFVFGGSNIDPTEGTALDFDATAAAFGTTVPAAGEGFNEATTTGEINGDGTVSGGISPEATFALAADAATVDEGGSASFTLTTTNVDEGTEVAYTISGVDAADVTGALTGTATVSADGTATISVALAADELTEGAETLILALDNGQASAGTVVQDTSLSVGNSYTSGLGVNGVTSDFNIEIVFEGVFSTSERTAFETAADYLSSLITGDQPDVGGIDDIRITARLEPIRREDGQPDGPFGTVGFAGPDALRSGSQLPYEGNMTFDTADTDRQLSDGTFAETIAHEMLHALGFGTIWEADFLGLLSDTPDLRFTGDNAIAAYNAIFTAIAAADTNSMMGVPVETDFGPGTARGHWDEETFTNEVMTGIGGSADFTSGMTVAALEDMGYDTIFDLSILGAAMPQLDTFMMA